MDTHHENITPPASPQKRDSPGVTADGIGRLSLEQGRGLEDRPSTHRGRGLLDAPKMTAAKRSASSELVRRPGRQSPGSEGVTVTPPAPGRNVRKSLRHGQRRYHLPSASRLPSGSGSQFGLLPTSGRSSVVLHQNCSHVKPPVPRESGYYSMASSKNTLKQQLIPTQSGDLWSESMADILPNFINKHFPRSESPHRDDENRSPVTTRQYNMPREPESSPLSQEQLEDEVKGIYGGLVMVEAKCITMDAAQAANPQAELTSEQWQARIALHRTLLYEHHDFLMATQHPSGTPALRELPTKYSMPARMWKHGIHAFLEVLRNHRPKSQDFMLAFIYIAYQMMALLFETVPSFIDTWIECLGDLSRYRMAIEEDKEAHATWGGVAARWYTLASDRHPATGRLYHHLGILERPSLRKFCFYAKSLSCVVPFWNAQDSLTTLCTPIVQDEKTLQSSRHSAEARIVTFHALVYLKNHSIAAEEVGHHALELLDQQRSKLRDIGAFLAVTNVAALFEFGSQSNPFWQLYATVINYTVQMSRPSANAISSASNNNRGRSWLMGVSPAQESKSIVRAADFCTATFNKIFRAYDEPFQMYDTLPYAHITLVWLHSLHKLRIQLRYCDLPHDSFAEFAKPTGFSSDALTKFLNSLVHHHPVSARVLECARQGLFPAPEQLGDGCPLPEDYLLRGLIWSQFYFLPGWFDRQNEDDGRMIESPSTQKARAERVLWLGLYLAVHTDLIAYDVSNQLFYAGGSESADEMSLDSFLLSSPSMGEPSGLQLDSASEAPEMIHRDSISTQSSSVSEDGFTFVNLPQLDRMTSSSTAIAPGRQPFNNPLDRDFPPIKNLSEDVTPLSADGDKMLWNIDRAGRTALGN